MFDIPCQPIRLITVQTENIPKEKNESDRRIDKTESRQHISLNFTGLRIIKENYRMQGDSNLKPVVHAPRKITSQNGSRKGTSERRLEMRMSDKAKSLGLKPGCCTKSQMLTQCEGADFARNRKHMRKSNI